MAASSYSIPRILLVTTDRLPSTARIATAFARAGCTVAVLSPDQHPVQATRAVAQWQPYTGFWSLRSLETSIREIAPDFIIPCDDRAVQHLHRLHAATPRPAIRDLIERSLGPAGAYAVLASRHDFLTLAGQEGVRVPDVRPVRGVADLTAWGAEHPFPWVLKADGSWAGQGVRIVFSLPEAEQAFHELSQPVSGWRTLSGLLIDRDSFWLEPFLSRARRAVSVQHYISGWPANCAVACWEGEVLAGLAIEAIETLSRTGPCSVARVTDRPEMLEFARRIVRALRLSGLVGFDFMIEAATERPYVIEMNPRNTPICHLQLGRGRDLIGALHARLTGTRPREEPPVTAKDMIALFPTAWVVNPASELLHNCYHDVPWDEPELVRALVRPSLRARNRLVRSVRALRDWMADRAPSVEPAMPPALAGEGPPMPDA